MLHVISAWRVTHKTAPRHVACDKCSTCYTHDCTQATWTYVLEAVCRAVCLLMPLSLLLLIILLLLLLLLLLLYYYNYWWYDDDDDVCWWWWCASMFLLLLLTMISMQSDVDDDDNDITAINKNIQAQLTKQINVLFIYITQDGKTHLIVVTVWQNTSVVTVAKHIWLLWQSDKTHLIAVTVLQNTSDWLLWQYDKTHLIAVTVTKHIWLLWLWQNTSD